MAHARRHTRRRVGGGGSGKTPALPSHGGPAEISHGPTPGTGTDPSQGQGLVALPASLSDTWLVINKKLLASQRMAAQNFHASRSRVEALRHSLARRRAQFQAERKKRREAQRAARLLVGLGHHDDTLNFALGAALFGAMAFIAGAAPGLIPTVYVAFFLYMMPARTVYFVQRKWTFFLIDFCYWANMATTVVLLFYPLHEQYAALVFAMNEGPLAGALVVWQCAWVFGSREHTFSALMHLLPGLAVHCNRYYLGPKGAPALISTLKALVDGSDTKLSWTRLQINNMGLGWQWHVLYPLFFYCGWQLGYFVVVQVLLCKFIRDNKYQTSYTMLAQRAAKTNNFWHRFVRRGSTMRRISLFGGIQFLFTVTTMLLAWPMFYSYNLSLLWQVVKVGVSLYYGSRMQCQVLPEKLGRLKIERHLAELNAQRPNPPPDDPSVSPGHVHTEGEADSQSELPSRNTVSTLVAED